jgi:ABC-type multidrug transport system fused ATPase/permease subunit
VIKKFLTSVAFLRKAFPGYKWPMFWLIFFSFVSSLLEGFGINAVIPLFSLLDKESSGGDAVSESIRALFTAFHLPFTIKMLLIIILLLFVFKGLILFGVSYFSAHYIFEYEQKTRVEIVSKTFSASWPFLIRQKGGAIEQILIFDISRSSNLITFFVSAVTLFTSLIVYSLLVVNISVIIAGITLVFGIIVLLILNPLFKRNRNESHQVGLLYKDIVHHIAQGMWGMKTIKALGVEEAFEKRIFAFFEKVKIIGIRLAWFKNISNILLQPMGIIFILGIFAFFYKTNNFHFASFAVIVYAINKVFNSIQILQGQLYQINEGLPYLKTVEEYRAIVSREAELHQGKFPFVFNNDLAFRSVSFGYKDNQVILKDVNFKIKKGEMTGIVGPSGSGKTTIADLLLRFYQPQNGSIELDGTRADKIDLDSWRHSIAYVAQEPFLINDSIRNNITFYRVTVSDEELKSAAEAANIYETIMGLPEKFETIIGDRGSFLSVGQRQRIVLARIFLLQPQILLLDEPTSGLDNESERLIQASIEKLRKKTTIIVIAHRLSTILSADSLMVVDDGKVIEQGPPQELLQNKKSYFAQLYTRGVN